MMRVRENFFRQLVTPWPLRPLTTGIFATLFFIAFTSGQRFGAGEFVTPATTADVLSQSFATAAIIAAIIWLANRMLPTWVRTGWGFFSVILVTSIAVAAIRTALGLFPVENFASPAAAYFYAAFRIAILIWIVTLTAGMAAQRLQRQVDATEAALERARHQQQLVLTADERMRSQVASLLHNRVQAALIASCLQLQVHAQRAPESDRQELQTIIDRLEEVRSLDVRRAARSLSPDLTDVDLQTALEELCSQYEPAMATTIRVHEALLEQGTGPDPHHLLGCYRIIEQAVLNSAVHGRAGHCTIDVSVDSSDISLSICDDGVGLSDDSAASSGLGTAITATWIRLMAGTWVREPGSPKGTVVHARVPLASPSPDQR